MANKFNKSTVTISKGSKESTPLFLGGSKIRTLGLPVDENGSVNFSGSALSFFGTYDGPHWFSLNDVTGKTLVVSTRVQQNYITAPSALASAPAMVPLSLPNAALFEGVLTVILISNVIESADRSIDVYTEGSNL